MNKEQLTELYNKTIKEVQEIDPNFVPPASKQKKGIVT